MGPTEHTLTELMRPPTHNRDSRFTRIAFILPNTAEEAFLFPVVRNNFVVPSILENRCASISECEALPESYVKLVLVLGPSPPIASRSLMVYSEIVPA
jgi:hypothetical protein